MKLKINILKKKENKIKKINIKPIKGLITRKKKNTNKSKKPIKDHKKKIVRKHKQIPPVELNILNLKNITTILNENNIEYTIFFGSLLGYVRENNLIKNDDDIDIMLDKKYFNKIKILLNKYRLNIEKKNIFLQYQKEINEYITSIDFYFFEKKSEYIELKWHFYSYNKNVKDNTFLHIPEKLLFPFNKVNFFDFTISIPISPILICEYLYGKRFREPLSKIKKEYTHQIIKNKPVIKYFK
jgi:hypothetical protein